MSMIGQFIRVLDAPSVAVATESDPLAYRIAPSDFTTLTVAMPPSRRAVCAWSLIAMLAILVAPGFVSADDEKNPDAIARAVSKAAMLKVVIAETTKELGTLPETLEETGLSHESLGDPSFNVAWEPPAISIVFKSDSPEGFSGTRLQVIAVGGSDPLHWICRVVSNDARTIQELEARLPAQCLSKADEDSRGN